MSKTFAINNDALGELHDILTSVQADQMAGQEYSLEDAESVAQEVKEQLAILFEEVK